MDTLHDFLHSVINAIVPHDGNDYRPHLLQKGAMLMMLLLVLVSFLAANFQAVLWQSSQWLVGAVLPAVVVDITNTKRANLELPVLVRNPVLDAAATLKAEDMSKNNYFSHDSPSGVTPWHWFKEAGYPFVFAGENLAIYFSDSAEVVDAWMKSPTHRANIVGSQYREIGVGTARGTYQGFDTVYVVQMFGAPALMPTSAQTSALTPASVRPAAAVKLPASAPVAPLAIATTRTATNTDQVNESSTEPLVAGEMTDTEEGAIEKENKMEAVVAVKRESDPAGTQAEEAVSDKASVVAEATSEMSVPPTENPTSLALDDSSEVVSFYSQMAASSTNLAPALYTTIDLNNAPIPKLAILATEPNKLLQLVYLVLGGITAFVLLLSVVLEWRHHRPLQTVYGLMLLLIMVGLFYVHTTIMSGAVIL